MFESLVITLREGIEVALIVGIVWIYLRETGRRTLIPAVNLGLALGVGASLLLAYFLAQLNLSSSLVEGTLILVAAFFVGTLVVWMMFTAKEMGKAIRQKAEKIASYKYGPAAFLGMIAFILVMVLREGFETVVFLKSVWMTNRGDILNVIGAVLGLVISVVFGVLFITGSMRINLERFFKVTSVALMIFIVQLVIYGMHELGEAGVMGWMPAPAMGVIDTIAEYNVLFILAVVAIPVLFLTLPTSKETLTPQQRRLRFSAAAVGLVVVFAIGYSYVSQRVAQAISEVALLIPEAGEIELELEELPAGQPVLFYVREGSEQIPLAVARLDGDVVAATGRLTPDSRLTLHQGSIYLVEQEGAEEELYPLVPVEVEVEGEEIEIELEELEEALSELK